LGAVQYVTDDGSESVVLAYWGVRHYGPYPVRLPLTALDPVARYRDVGTSAEHSGAELMSFGTELSGPIDLGSALVHLERLPASSGEVLPWQRRAPTALTPSSV
jgi:alpha-galactosidase